MNDVQIMMDYEGRWPETVSRYMLDNLPDDLRDAALERMRQALDDDTGPLTDDDLFDLPANAES